ncbi:MAG: hypothetical protein ACYDHW_09845 [Syntrophorhabdaceae bacterium]
MTIKNFMQDLVRTPRTPLFTGAMTKELMRMTFKDNEEAPDVRTISGIEEN